MRDGIAVNRCASMRFQELIQISSRNEADMWGWFQLILDSAARANRPTCRGFAKKRLIGLEPTTFCMAITPVSESRALRMLQLAGVS
jgi:hypothetical protein